jgi:hypothetical protein
MSEAARLAQASIARRSATRHDGGCQTLPAEHRVGNLPAARCGAAPGPLGRMLR